MNSICSHERLELALAGLLNADDESTLHLHLDECELCSAEMERLSGGEQASSEIASMLIRDDLDDAVPLREDCSTADFVVEHLEPSDDPAVLGRLGSYDVLELIGRGGMGVVLRGFDRELKRFVAIKALAPHLAHSVLARKRFAREAQAAAAVVDPHVIAIHQVQPNGQLPFLVMPLLTGESLAQRMKSRGTLELKETLRIGMQAAEGLAAAHGQGLIHRDVKPANILLEKGVERAVLTDFGLARAADDVSMTRWGIIAGTPEYMSPEQARGEVLDGRSDLFSLGCVLYEMATGVSPFRTDSTMATLRRIVDQRPAAMASLVPELPPWFSYIVERLLSKDPAQRFASASEVSQLLEQCLSHLQQPTSVPLPASLVPHATGRHSFFNVSRKGVIAILGTIGMTLLGMVLWQATEAPDISGQWTSDEWGTVVLEAKGAGQYEGTFSGSGNDKPDPRNATLGGGPGPDKLPDFLPPGVTYRGAIPLHIGFYPAISDKDKSGQVHVKWSRVERRFNGTWGTGDDRSGKLSLRMVDHEIRGGWTTDKDAQRESGTPRLADLLWTRRRETVGKGVKPPTKGEANDALAAEKAFQQLQSTLDDVDKAYDKALSNAKANIERERVEQAYEEQDPRQTFTPKYLAFEENYRGTPAALKALAQVMSFARSIGDPTCAAAKGRVEAVDRLMNHYLRHDGIEKTFDQLSGGPEVPRHNDFLQAVLENNSSRHIQAEVLVAQLELIRKTLNNLAIVSVPNYADRVAQYPEPMRAALQSQLRRLESMDSEKLRAEANEKIERLRAYQMETVAVYGSASKAANHLSHGINRVIVGKPAPEITATTTTGKVFRLSKLCGTTVVLVFAHNEGTDNDLMYAPLRKLAHEYKGNHVEVVMILANRDDQYQSGAALKRHLPWTVIPQPTNGPIILDWGIEGSPSVYIIDADGILHPQLGMPVYDDNSGFDTQDVAAALDQLLNDKEGTAKVSEANQSDA
jgi:serine/threonine protein kinase/peroxiredoxin